MAKLRLKKKNQCHKWPEPGKAPSTWQRFGRWNSTSTAVRCTCSSAKMNHVRDMEATNLLVELRSIVELGSTCKPKAVEDSVCFVKRRDSRLEKLSKPIFSEETKKLVSNWLDEQKAHQWHTGRGLDVLAILHQKIKIRDVDIAFSDRCWQVNILILKERQMQRSVFDLLSLGTVFEKQTVFSPVLLWVASFKVYWFYPERHTHIYICIYLWNILLNLEMFRPLVLLVRNSADPYHFKTLHAPLPLPVLEKFVTADHTATQEYGKGVVNEELRDEWHMASFEERTHGLFLFGHPSLPVPWLKGL